MDYIYLPCIQRIKDYESILTDAGISPVKHFDFFKNQYIYPELHHIYKKPAMFFEYRVQWTNRDRKVQTGEVEVRWHLELENYAASFDQSKNQARALEVFKYHRLIKGILHTFSGPMFRSLVCTSEEPDLNPTNTNVHIMTFTTKVEDDIALQIEKMATEEVQGDELDLRDQVPLGEVPPNDDRYVID